MEEAEVLPNNDHHNDNEDCDYGYYDYSDHYLRWLSRAGQNLDAMYIERKLLKSK